jgi:hypothetical protein
VTPLAGAVRARLALHRGDVLAARQELVSAQRLRGLLTYAVPVLAVQARLELTRAHLTLTDIAGARTLLREIDELLRRRPGPGTLPGQAEGLRARCGPAAPAASALSAAELRLLPLLPTNLPLAQSPPSCSCRRTPSGRSPSPSTGSRAPPAAATPWPGPGSSVSWTADRFSLETEIEGVLPWRRATARGAGTSRQASAAASGNDAP